MKIGIPAETRPGETRVAATPETIKKYVAAKHQVIVQSGAGVASSITDEAYQAAGAQIGSAADAFGTELVLKVRAPDADERALIKSGTTLVGMLNPFDTENIAVMAAHGLNAFALKLRRALPVRSHSTCCLQANIAGYKAVMLAALISFMPMLMTAAGTVKAARVLIMGVGVPV
jgi:NAD(P) transhydrogenase subunit alpha